MLSLGKENAIFETDGKIVVDAMHLSTVDLSEFGTIVQDCIYLLEQGVNLLFNLFKSKQIGLLTLWLEHLVSMLALVFALSHLVVLKLL